MRGFYIGSQNANTIINVSNSMEWKDAKTSKPPINKADKFDFENNISVKVLVYVKDNGYSFGRYLNRDNYAKWQIDGFLGNFEVTHYAEITNPL